MKKYRMLPIEWRDYSSVYSLGQRGYAMYRIRMVSSDPPVWKLSYIGGEAARAISTYSSLELAKEGAACDLENRLSDFFVPEEKKEGSVDDALEMIAEASAGLPGWKMWTIEGTEGRYLEQLARAAACYAMPDSVRKAVLPVDTHFQRSRTLLDLMWPFRSNYGSPVESPTTAERINDLKKAGALIVHEIGRLLELLKKEKGCGAEVEHV